MRFLIETGGGGGSKNNIIVLADRGSEDVAKDKLIIRYDAHSAYKLRSLKKKKYPSGHGGLQVQL